MIVTLSWVKGLSEAESKAMKVLRFGPGFRRLWWSFALLALLIPAPSAHASEFLFSFTAPQLLTALDASDPNHLQDGFFAVFLQVPTGYTAVQESFSDPTIAADWVATTESYSPFLKNTWVEFARNDSQSSVTLLSDANDGGLGNIFLGQTYDDGGSPLQPISFGTTPGTITNIMDMSSTAVFTIELSGPAIPGSLTFSGKASAIESNSTTSFANPTKTSWGNLFSITVTDIVVPEPATFMPLGLGVACLLAAGVFKTKTGGSGRS
jgi:hypothetical protein